MFKILGTELMSRDEFIESISDQEDFELETKRISKLVPKNFVVVSSETDGIEHEMFSRLSSFFGAQIYNDYVPLVTKMTMKTARKKFVAYTTGEMTWSVFINPEDLKMIFCQ